MSTLMEPSNTSMDAGGFVTPNVTMIHADELKVDDVVTNMGLVKSISRNGVFVVVAIAGTVWSTASGKGDVHTLDVVWHQSSRLTLDKSAA